MLVNKKCDKINMINSSKSLILFNQIQLTLSSIYHFSNSSHLCSYTACSSLSLEENHCYFSYRLNSQWFLLLILLVKYLWLFHTGPWCNIKYCCLCYLFYNICIISQKSHKCLTHMEWTNPKIRATLCSVQPSGIKRKMLLF